MCGIIAVLRRRARRATPGAADVLAALDAALSAVPERSPDPADLGTRLARAAAGLDRADALLRGVPGVRLLAADSAVFARLRTATEELTARAARIEEVLDADPQLAGSDPETTNQALVRFKDALWAVGRDRLRHVQEVLKLAGTTRNEAALGVFSSLQTALSSLDRLEVRGRDSAGITVLVRGHGLDPGGAEIRARMQDPLFTDGSVRVADGCLSFVYKAAAEIGELGDNTRALRLAIASDALLHAAVRADTAEALVLGHTRWASVGIISQPNAHPVNSEETGGRRNPYVCAVLNGDVDNYQELKAGEGLALADEITTDTKVIPVLIARRLAEGVAHDAAFLRTVASFHGSVAIGATCSSAPDKLWLALRGSGQALYVGLAEDAFVVASEPYGLVEETARYLRLDGETPGNPANPSASQGQVVVLDRAQAGELGGITRFAYDGTALPPADRELRTAQITTRDIDRGPYPHFLLKEISESPASFHKTLRGRIRDTGGRLRVTLQETLVRVEGVRRVLVIGQGTAAVAGQGVAMALAELLRNAPIAVQALPATELSGFQLRDDMRDTLVVAISQSGTTTDTNRTVDLVKARGARIVAIVNRRNSDLCDKAHAVLYTSDGRDVEMSVASTKAFYAQIAAGYLLALGLARAAGCADDRVEDEWLRALRGLPERMQQVLAQRQAIAEIAAAHAPQRRYWALVGNGRNRVAAAEVRIKLSELCYKSLASDATEDKKHIDLSAEPLILVCAAGLSGSTADDVQKEVAIYKAHKAAPIVIATAGETRFAAARAVITVPETHPALAFVLSTVAGHLFGYGCALAIDATARPLREMRAAVESLVSHPGHGDAFAQLAPRLRAAAQDFTATLRQGRYDGSLEARTALRIASLLNYVQGLTPLESYESEWGHAGTPGRVIEELTDALTRGIEELGRPIDAIKHQAKTVTVGISRNDEALLLVPLVQKVLEAGAPREHLSYKELRTIAALDPAVRQVTGFTRYRIDGEKIAVVAQGGSAKSLPSRTAKNPLLRGTKHTVAQERQVFVALGRSDARTVVLVPEVHANQTTALTLLHVQLHERLPATTLRGVLDGYRNRWAALEDAVAETEPAFRQDLLEKLTVAELLTTPVHVLADRWRNGA